MAVTITTINSYVTLANAEIYFENRLYSDVWEDASENDKKRALITSTQAIERLNFAGSKADTDQTLQFPRNDDSAIPQTIKDAVCENALALLDDFDVDFMIERSRVSQESIADIRTSFNTNYVQENMMSGIASATAWIMLKPYLRDAGVVKVRKV